MARKNVRFPPRRRVVREQLHGGELPPQVLLEPEEVLVEVGLEHAEVVHDEEDGVEEKFLRLARHQPLGVHFLPDARVHVPRELDHTRRLVEAHCACCLFPRQHAVIVFVTRLECRRVHVPHGSLVSIEHAVAVDVERVELGGAKLHDSAARLHGCMESAVRCVCAARLPAQRRDARERAAEQGRRQQQALAVATIMVVVKRG